MLALVSAGATAAGPRSRADLVEARLSVTPATVTPTGTLTISDAVTNRGRATSKRSTTDYFLGETLLGSRRVPALKPHKTSAGTTHFAVSSYTDPGAYQLRACADDTKAVKESNERNNCRAVRLTVAAQSHPPPPPPPGNSDGEGYARATSTLRPSAARSPRLRSSRA